MIETLSDSSFLRTHVSFPLPELYLGYLIDASALGLNAEYPRGLVTALNRSSKLFTVLHSTL